jgi:hypothetical protein
MKKHIAEVIRQAGEHSETKITEIVMMHFKDLGFELVKRKDLKKQEKTIKKLHLQIHNLVSDNWEIAMQLYEARLHTNNPANTTIEATNPDNESLISTQAVTEGARRGVEANNVDIEAIMNSLDSHINKMTKTLDDANLTRIKFELDEQEALLDEPDEAMEDPALTEATRVYQQQIAEGYSPYQARIVAMRNVKLEVENSGYEAYWIDVYNHLRASNFTS